VSRSEVLIGIDAGTSVIKAVAFTADGEALGQCSRQNHYNTLDNGGVEQGMQRTFDDTVAVLEELISAIPELAERVVGLAVTGQGDGTWLADARGQPLHDGWLWLDGRSGAEAAYLEQLPRYDEVYARTGTGVNVCQMRTHLTWMKRHAKDLLKSSATAFHCKDWLYFGLTGERATDPSEGVFGFGSYQTRDYDDVVIDALELADLRELLPPIVDGMKTSAPLIDSIAARTGLPAGLPVTLGYVDVICSALGGGLYSGDGVPGLSIVGSTGMHMRLVRQASDVVLNAERTGYTMCFPGDCHAQMQSNMAATLNIDWLLDTIIDANRFAGFDTSRTELLARLDALVATAEPGRLLYHPYASRAGERGPFIDPMARASLIGLDGSSGLAEVSRAVFEGLALAARDCFDAMGERPAEVRLSGGAARSPVLRSIIAAALGRPVRVVERDEAGAAGACMMAATALGLHESLDTCVEEWVDAYLGEAQPPDPELAAQFDTLMPIYRQARQSLGPVWETLAAVRHEADGQVSGQHLSESSR